MEQIQEQVKRIQQKAQDLLRRQQQAQKDLEKLRAQNQELKEQVQGGLQKIKILEEQQYILKSAAGQLDPSDKKAFELSINRYLKEIDKCIALLSE